MNKGAGGTAGLGPVLDQLFRERVERRVLPNGLTVLLKEDRSARLASVQAWVKTGSIHEGEQLGSGLSHFLEHMLFKGTEKRPGNEISRAVQAAGGYLNAYTTFDRTVYYVDLPSEAVALGIDVLSDAVFASVLPDGEVEKEREVILREIDMGLDDPDRILSQALFNNAYREHPYRQPVIGHRESFEAVVRDDLTAYYQSRYVPENVVLLAVGDFDAAELAAVVEEQAGAHPRRRLAPVFIPGEPAQLSRRDEALGGEVNICRGFLGFKVPHLTHPDSPALDVLASVLGNGNSSYLWRRLREERKLVHYVDAASWNPGSSGLFWVSFACDSGRGEEVTGAVLEELGAAARAGFGADRVERAVRQAAVGEINTRKTMGGQASRLGLAEVVVGDLGYPRHYFSRIQEVVAGDLAGLIETYLVEGGLTAVTLDTKPSPPPVAPAAAARASYGDFEERAVANGARILHQRDPRLPKVHLRAVFLGGPLYEVPGRRGSTGLMATLLARDTASRDAEAVAEAIEGAAGSMGEFAGNNSFGLSLEVLPADLDLALDLLSEALCRPAFAEGTFGTERDAQVAQIKEDEDDIVSFGRSRLREIFFGQHPYGHSSEGTVDDLQALAPADVRAHWERLVVPSNTVLAVAGDFEPDALLPRLEDLLVKLPDRPFEPSRPAFEGPPEPGAHERTLPREQAVVFQAYPDVGVVDDDAFTAGELLEEMFNEMSGNLFTRVREERSLAYFVGTSRIAGVHTGAFYFYAGTQPATAGDVFAEIQKEVDRVRGGGLTEAEVARCKTRLKVAKRMGQQTIGARAVQAALNLTYGLPANAWKLYDEKVDAIGRAELQAFAQKHFRDEAKVTLVVKPEV